MGKRAAAAATKTAKKVKVDPITEKCMQVYTALENLGDIPKATCEMLEVILPLCLGICQNDRHQYQQSTVEAVANELEKIEAAQQKKISEEEAAINSLEQEKQSHEATVSELETARSTKEDIMKTKTLELCEEATVFKNTKCAVKEAEDTQKDQDKEFAKIEKKKVDLEEILQGKFQSLKEGCMEQAEATTCAAGVIAHLQGLFDVNETLAKSLPSALGKLPASRGAFDTMAIQTLQEDADKCLTEWNALLRDAEKVRAERAAKVQSAHEAFNTAKERQLASADTFTSAQEELASTQRLFAEAKRKLRAVPAAQHKVEKRLQDARNKLETFRQGPLLAFAELRDRNQLEVEGNNSNVTATEAVTAEADAPMVPAEA